MATKFIQDNGFDQAMLDLVKKVFELNKVTKYDPTDYVPVKVSAAFKLPGLIKHNSIMHLSPLSSNMRRPNLRLAYDREDIGDILEPFDPKLNHVDINAPAHDMIDEINKCIGNQVTLRKEDFYDSYVAQGEEHTFIDLHAKPDSYFYYGNYKIPVIDTDLFILTFEINPYKSFYPTGMTLDADIKDLVERFRPVKMTLEARIFNRA
jgi:hypothetical protein